MCLQYKNDEDALSVWTYNASSSIETANVLQAFGHFKSRRGENGLLRK